MYRVGSDYDKIAQLAIDILIDYNITTFPVEERELCRKMGINLIGYSEFSETDQEILKKKSNDAFYVPATKLSPPSIFIIIAYCLIQECGTQYFTN